MSTKAELLQEYYETVVNKPDDQGFRKLPKFRDLPAGQKYMLGESIDFVGWQVKKAVQEFGEALKQCEFINKQKKTFGG